MSSVTVCWTVYKDDIPIKTFETENDMLRYALEIGAISRFMKKKVICYQPNMRYSFGYEEIEDGNNSPS